MKFNVNQQDLQQALSYCQGVIEKRSTLPILSNVLLDASNSQLTITATDLDVIFVHQIKNIDCPGVFDPVILQLSNRFASNFWSAHRVFVLLLFREDDPFPRFKIWIRSTLI